MAALPVHPRTDSVDSCSTHADRNEQQPDEDEGAAGNESGAWKARADGFGLHLSEGTLGAGGRGLTEVRTAMNNQRIADLSAAPQFVSLVG